MVKKALKLVSIGETGIGKSKLGNFILQKKYAFKVGDTSKSETKSIIEHNSNVDGMELTIMDTPGLNDTDCCDSEIMDIIISKFQNDKSIDGIILVYSFTKTRKVDKDKELIKNLKTIFGEDILKLRLKVIVTNRTYGPEFEDEKHKVETQTRDITNLLNNLIDKNDIIFVNTCYIETYIKEFYPQIKNLLDKFFLIKNEHGSMDNQLVKKKELEIIEKRNKELEEERKRLEKKMKEEEEKRKEEERIRKKQEEERRAEEERRRKKEEEKREIEINKLEDEVRDLEKKIKDLNYSIHNLENDIYSSNNKIENLKREIQNDINCANVSNAFTIFTLGFSAFGTKHCLDSKKNHENQLRNEMDRKRDLENEKYRKEIDLKVSEERKIEKETTLKFLKYR
jgi:predicted GTPase